MGLNLEEWGVSADLMGFIVCAVTVHNDETIREYHPNQSKENRDEIFLQIADDLGLRQKSIQKFYAKYRHYLTKETTTNLDYKEYEKRRWDKIQ